MAGNGQPNGHDILERDLSGEVRRLGTELQQVKALLIALVLKGGGAVLTARDLGRQGGFNVAQLPDGAVVLVPVVQRAEQPLVVVPTPVVRQ